MSISWFEELFEFLCVVLIEMARGLRFYVGSVSMTMGSWFGVIGMERAGA